MEAGGGGLEATLADVLGACSDPSSAAEAIVEHLASLGYEMPSVYFARGGRLRCTALRGYTQVRDGFLPGMGVLGICYSTGEVQEIRDVADEPAFLQTVQGVREEVAAPIVLRGEVVGVVNIEARDVMPASTVDLAVACAAALASRIDELGGMPGESLEQRLVRHAVAIASLSDELAIVDALAGAARELVAMSSAFVVIDPDGQSSLRHAAGPLGHALASLPEAEVAEISAWVRTGTSVYSVSDTDGDAFVGNEILHALGVRSIVVLPLLASGSWLGDLVLADEGSTHPGTDDVGRLELLVAQAASSLLTARLLGDLRQQAATDPLTRLGHHASFTEAVDIAHRMHAPSQRPAVLVIDVDNFKRVNDEHGHPHGDRVLLDVVQEMAGALRDGDRLYRVGGDEFAAVLLVSEEQEAHAVAERLRSAVERSGHGTVSIGLAVGGAGDLAATTVQRADRALYEAKRSGRNDVVTASV